MAGEMFGAPEGFSRFEEDAYRRAATEHTLGQIAMQPAERRLRTAQASAAELALEQEQMLARLMQQASGGQVPVPGLTEEAAGLGIPGLEQIASGGKPTSITDQFDTLATLAAQSGLVTKAKEMATASALIKAREATQRNQAQQAQLNRLKTLAQQAETSAQIFGGSKNAAEWAQANDLFEFNTGQASPFRDVEYSPALVNRINASALTAKERADAAEKATSRGDLKSFRDARLKQHDLERKVREERNRIAKEREERLKKQGGGKTIAAPRTEEVSQIRSMIVKDFPAFQDSTDLKEAAFAVASEARALQRTNPALSSSAALAQAYSSALQAGDFAEEGGIAGFRKKGVYKGRGRTPQTAIPIPMSGSKIAADKLVKDKYYVGAGGALGKWTGKGMLLVTGSGNPLSSDNGDPDNEDLDEGEE